MNARKRRVMLVAVLALVIMGAAFAGGAWYLLGEARRTGRLVATILSSRTGLPITVARARMDGTRLYLVDLRVTAGPLQVRVAEVEVTGMLPLVAPAGRRLSVVAVSASVRVEAGAGAAGGATSEAVRAPLRALLDWPGLFDLRVEEGRLQTAAADERFRLVGDKDATGLTLTLTLGPQDSPKAVSLNARATPFEPEGVGSTIELNVEPARVGTLWPEAVPAPTKVTVRGDVQLPRGGDLIAHGRAIFEDAQRTAVAIDFTAQMTAAPDGGAIRASASGTLDGSPLSAQGTYQLGTDALQAELDLSSVDADRLGRRLGLAPLPVALTARRLVARVSGPQGGPQPMATVTIRADAVTASMIPTLVMDAVLDTRLRLAGARLAGVDNATLRFTRGGGALAVARFSSRGATLWPLAV